MNPVDTVTRILERIEPSEGERLANCYKGTPRHSVRSSGVLDTGKERALSQLQILPLPTGESKKDALFEAVADHTVPGWREGLTDSARGALNRAVKNLRSIKVVPEEVPHLVEMYRYDMPTCSLTPSALAKHAPRLRGLQLPATTGWDMYETPRPAPRVLPASPEARAALAYDQAMGEAADRAMYG